MFVYVAVFSIIAEAILLSTLAKQTSETSGLLSLLMLNVNWEVANIKHYTSLNWLNKKFNLGHPTVRQML